MKRAARIAALAVPLAVLGVFFAWPVAAMLVRGVGADALATYAAARTWRLVWTTLWLALAGTLGSVILGLPAAYALYVCRFPGRGVLRSVITMPFVLPTVVVGAAFGSLLREGGLWGALGVERTPAAVILAMVFFNMSVVVRGVGTMWAGLDPRMQDAARMLGAGPWRVFCTVTLPSLRPAIMSAAALVFLFCSTAYGIVMTLGGVSTLESEIWSQSMRLNFETAAALSLVQFVIVGVCLALTSKRHDVALRTVAFRVRRGHGDWAAILYAGVVTVTLVVTPLVSLVAQSLRRGGDWSLENFRALARTGDGFAGGTTVVEALGNSVVSACVAAMLALAMGVPLAVALSRTTPKPRVSPTVRGADAGCRGARPSVRGGRTRLDTGRLVEAFAMAPLGVSAVTLGFGFLLVLQSGPLYLGARAVPVAQAIVAMPMVLRALLPVLRSINPRLRESASMLGAGPLRTLATVDAPAAAGAFAQAAGYALAMSLGEFGASSFLANGSNITLPVLISRLLGRPGGGNYQMALAASVILGVVTVVIMASCEAFRPQRSSRKDA